MTSPAPRAGWLIPLAALVLILDLVALTVHPPQLRGGSIPYRVRAEAPKLPEVQKRAENRELVEQLLQQMTLEQKIGQLLLVGGWSDYPANNIAAIRDWHLGNIAVTSRDVADLGALAQGIRDSQDTALIANGGVPLMVATTQEGGAFDAITSGGLTHLPAAADLGEYAEALEIERGYSYIGAELKSLGINTCLAPLMDVGSVTQSPLVADKRTWGRSSSLVTSDGIAAIAGLQNGGIAACARDFPGMGATPVDANRALPVIDYSLADIEASDLVPFQSAVRQEVALVMVGHVCYPIIQGQRQAPAWTSKLMVQNLLRDRLNYAGVVMTSDLAAGSVDRGDETLVDQGLQALKAGCDLLYFTGGPDRAALLATGLLTAAQNGDLAEDVIDTAVARILRLKTAYNLFEAVKEQPLYLAQSAIPELAAHQQGVGQLFENMELRQNPNQERRVTVGLPGAPAVELPVGGTLLVAHVDRPDFQARYRGFTLGQLIQQRIPSALDMPLTLAPDRKTGELENLREACESASVIVVGTWKQVGPGQRQMLQTIARAGKPVLVISRFSDESDNHELPRDVQQFYWIVNNSPSLNLALEQLFHDGLLVPPELLATGIAGGATGDTLPMPVLNEPDPLIDADAPGDAD